MRKDFNIKRMTATVMRNPQVLLIKLLETISPLIGDSIYLKLLFPLKVGYKLNLKNPQTYNEKIQWLKLYYRDPILPKLVDKYEYKEYVKKMVGEEYVVKNYGVWHSVEDIDLEKLPSQFVLKTTHDQGGVVICKDKTTFDFVKAKRKLNKHMKRDLYYLSREWPYKSLKPRIIAEELLIDNEKGDLWDYKFYCFHGEPKAMYISMGRQSTHVPFYYYDMDFNVLDIDRPHHESDGKIIEKPENWESMKEIARKMSAGQPHVRIDFYDIKGKLFLGEYTLFQGGGLMPFSPRKWDYTFGSWLDIEKLKKINQP